MAELNMYGKLKIRYAYNFPAWLAGWLDKQKIYQIEEARDRWLPHEVGFPNL